MLIEDLQILKLSSKFAVSAFLVSDVKTTTVSLVKNILYRFKKQDVHQVLVSVGETDRSVVLVKIAPNTLLPY